MYLVGTEFKKIQMKGRGVLVRTGGGYMYLSEYLLHYAKAECLKIGVMMLKLRKPFKETIQNIIGKRDNSELALKDWAKRCPQGIDKQFNELVLAVRTLEVKLSKMR